MPNIITYSWLPSECLYPPHLLQLYVYFISPFKNLSIIIVLYTVDFDEVRSSKTWTAYSFASQTHYLRGQPLGLALSENFRSALEVSSVYKLLKCYNCNQEFF